MSYYQTYRPQKFSELVGQTSVRRILQSAMIKQRLAHAYLFAGSRGTGKTTTARLLAKLVNCLSPQIDEKTKTAEPCNQCSICLSIASDSCLDVIEIDAASNRGIEEIRTLQDQVKFPPQQADKKIVIIDEVHMLTKEAFNALLKTIEEPPSYLIFILATTETHKVPATIVSRCQLFNFRTPSANEIVEFLNRLVKAEKLTVEPESLILIADFAAGSFRDSANLLEQLTADTKSITAEYVVEQLGLPNAQLVENYILTLDEPDSSKFSNLNADLERFFANGGSAVAFIDRSFQVLANMLKDGVALKSPEQLLGTLIKVKYRMKHSPLAYLPIMVSIPPALKDSTSAIQPSEQTSPPKQFKESMAVEPTLSAKPEIVESPTVTVPVAEQIAPVEPPASDLGEIWQKTIAQLVAQDQSSLVAILRTAKPLHYHDGTLKLSVQFTFHADQLRRQKNRGILEAVLTQICDCPTRLEIEIHSVEDVASLAEELAL